LRLTFYNPFSFYVTGYGKKHAVVLSGIFFGGGLLFGNWIQFCQDQTKLLKNPNLRNIKCQVK